jgi:ABC-type phosphate/phosphonate transport system substrate-binding protein
LIIRRRLSLWLLLLSSISTLVVLLGTGALMGGIYRAALRDVYASAPVVERPAGAPIIVGVGRTPGGPKEWITYVGVFSRLQESLGRPVILRYASGRINSADLVRESQVDFALVSTGAYVALEREGAALLVVTPIIDGREQDAAVLVVSAGCDAQDLSGLQGARLATTPGSLAGEGFVRWLLSGKGSDLHSYFGTVIEAESPDTCLALVVSGDADVTAVRRSDLAPWPDGALKVIVTSPEFAMPPLVARADLSPTLVSSVRESLLLLGAGDGIPLASALDGFRPVERGEYVFARLLNSLVGPPDVQPQVEGR